MILLGEDILKEKNMRKWMNKIKTVVFIGLGILGKYMKLKIKIKIVRFKVKTRIKN